MKLTKYIKMHGNSDISIFCVDKKDRLQGFYENYNQKIEPFGNSSIISEVKCYKNNVRNGMQIHNCNKELEIVFVKSGFRFGQQKNGESIFNIGNYYPLNTAQK